MSTFNRFCAKVRRATLKMTGKVEESVDNAAASVRAKNLEIQIDEQYENLGRIVYRDLHTEEDLEEKKLEIIAAIDAMFDELEEIKADKTARRETAAAKKAEKKAAKEAAAAQQAADEVTDVVADAVADAVADTSADEAVDAVTEIVGEGADAVADTAADEAADLIAKAAAEVAAESATEA